MKKTFVSAAALIMLAVIAVSLCACQTEEESLKHKSDIATDGAWNTYSVLAEIPKYELGGTFVEASKPNSYGDAVTVAFSDVSKDDFLAYANVLEQSGFVMKESSSLWINQDVNGMPQFTKNGKMVTLSWNSSGSLQIIVAFA